LRQEEIASTRLYELDPLGDSRWKKFVAAHPNASVFHCPNWLQALRATYGYESAVLTTAPPQEPLTDGLVFCRIRSPLTGRRIVSLPFSDHCEPLVDAPEDFDAMLAHLRRVMSDSSNRYIEVRPLTARPGASTGFDAAEAFAFHTIDLSPGSEALFRTFHKDSVQRKIRRAERESLSYDVGNSEDLLEKFYRLLVITRRRHHLPPQPLSWFRNLGKAFGDGLEVRLASHNGYPVASILTLKHGSKLIYKYGCSDLRASNLGGTALLFWKTIQESAHKGLSEFDLGRSSMDNEGLIRFKDHWGTRRATLQYFRYPVPPESGGGAWKTDLRKFLVKVAPDRLLIASGRLLYPHLG
jgi:CelD/BcsL family acetyltransferase involved in cellulose biosynthesis